jgi:6-phosphogluconolactonase
MTEIFYVGNYSKGIKICKFAEGVLEIIGESSDVANPSYVHVNKNVLYAVSETEAGGIAEFEITNDGLNFKSFKEIKEDSPCHIITDDKREKLIVSNYGSGTLQMYELDEEGTIGKQICKKTYEEDSHMHFADFIEEDIYAVDLGSDAIHIYDTDMELRETISAPLESGPRHLVVSKGKSKVYVVTELSNHVLAFKRYGDNKRMELIQKISTLVGNDVESFAGAIKISKDNRNIYVTNRGHNSISVFNIHGDTLELIQNISSNGDFPRDIILNETEEYALVANQKSNDITIFKRNKENGLLSLVEGQSLSLESPTCIERRHYEI